MILRWQLQQGIGVIPRATRTVNLANNLALATENSFRLLEEEMEALNRDKGSFEDQWRAELIAEEPHTKEDL